MSRFSQLLVVFTLSLFANAAAAQDLVVLVSQSADEGQAPPAYWWAEKSPSYSQFDSAIFDAMTRAGTLVTRPEDLSQVSRIYRRPDLSDANAVNFAGLVGARFALVGTWKARNLSPLGPLRLQGVEIELDARLVRRNASGAVRVAKIVETREVAFGATIDEARANAVERVVSRAATDIAHSTRVVSHGDADGPPGAETLVGIRKSDDPRILDTLRNAFSERADVTDAVPAWLSGGVIALELNSGQVDDDAFVRKVAGEVASRADLGFTLVPVGDARDGLVEFEVVQTPQPH